jgi:hypothetical protein
MKFIEQKVLERQKKRREFFFVFVKEFPAINRNGKEVS